MMPSPHATERQRLTNQIRDVLAAQSFDRIAIGPAVEPTGLHRFYEWLERGYAGEMHYLQSRRDAYAHPDNVLDGCRSVIALTLEYSTVDPRVRDSSSFDPDTADPDTTDPDTTDYDAVHRETANGPICPTGHGRISRYAWGTIDYHDLIHSKLKQAIRELGEDFPALRARGVVDTAPMLEREYGRLTGLGWQGKNTMLINRAFGSWFFLAFMLVDAELEYDPPNDQDYCGTCTACLDHCPTNAFVEPYVLDARRCISYLTIEKRGMLPSELREGLGDWLFGCDVCQEVCPWNRFAPETDHPGFLPTHEHGAIDLIGILELDDESFRERFRKTPLWRSKRSGILRNAAIVLGNQRHTPAVPALIRVIDDADPTIRAAAVWSLGQFNRDPSIEEALTRRKSVEQDSVVLQELADVLDRPV